MAQFEKLDEKPETQLLFLARLLLVIWKCEKMHF